jgi:superfamily II DNA or RNA helicase
LCEQAAEEFEEAWGKLGNRRVALAPYWGRSDTDVGRISDGIVIGGFAKVYSAAVASLPWLATLSDRTSFIVVDEAHQVIAPTYRLVVDGLLSGGQGKALLGLTATPGRTWADVDKDRELAEFFAQSKVTLTVPGYESPVEFLIADGYLARPEFRSLRYSSSVLSSADLRRIAQEFEIPQSVLNTLAEDDLRNLLIVKTLEDLARRHSRILVFSATVAHAQVIAAVLCAVGLDARAVTAQTPPSDRSQTVAWYKEDAHVVRVLVNFGVFTAGFDAPRTSAALIARPTKSLVLYSQMVGRATRGPRAGGNSNAEIVTVVDTALAGFGSMADAFENWEDVWSKV